MSNRYAKEYQKNSNKTALFIIIIVLSFVGSIPLFFVMGPYAILITAVGVIIGFVGLSSSTSAQDKNADDFKREYVVPRMMEFFSDFEYKPTHSLQPATIREIKLFNYGDSIYTDELIQGRYRGCSFIMGNVKCTQTNRGSDGQYHVSTVFNGRLIIIGTSVIRNGEVTIKPKEFLPSFLKRGQKLEYNHSICDKYEIRGSDYIELPKYLLDHIENFGTIFKKYKFYYKIVNDRIYLAINHIGKLYDVGNCKNNSIEEIDEIIKKDSVYFTNLISLILDANKMEV